MSAVSNSNQSRFRVAIIVDTNVSVVRDFLAGFYRAVRPAKDWLVMQVEVSDAALDAVLLWEPDALIVSSRDAFMPRLDACGRPFLCIQSVLDVGERPWVGMDERAIGQTAAEHLIKTGYSRAACIYQSSHHGSLLRMQGFVDTLQTASIPVELYVANPVESPDYALRLYTPEDPALGDWLCNLPASTGIFAWCDNCARWVADACLHHDLNIPVRLGLVGVDNQLDVCLAAWPNLDSVVLRHQELGRAAVDWLVGVERDESVALPEPLKPTGVNRRKSTLFQAAGNPILSRAIQLIQSRAVSDLSVDCLVEESECSRRTLERYIREFTGLSLRETIELRRLEEAENLLANTDRTVADITSACGFATTRSLELLFKKHHQMSPAAYGKAHKASF